MQENVQTYNTENTLQSQSDITKYKSNYSLLVNSYSDLCKIHNDYLNIINNNNDNIKPNLPDLPQIDNILDSYAIRVARKKDTYEKISTLEGICEGNEIFLIKHWKRKCRFLSELIAEVYKSYKNLYNEMNNKQSNITSRNDIEKLTSYLRFITPDSSLNLECSDYDKWDMFINVSVGFIKELLNNYTNYKSELHQQIIIKERLFYVLKKAKDQRSRLKVYVNKLRDEITYVEKKLRESAHLLATQNNNDNDLIGDNLSSSSSPSDDTYNIPNELNKEYYENKISELEKIIKEEEKRRKHLHNKFQELIGNTRVFCRIKLNNNNCLKVLNDDKIILPAEFINDKVLSSSKCNDYKSSHCFIFDRIFGINSTQKDIFSTVDSLITSSIDGYNVCIMSYGQSGSGKSYTMIGTDANPGILLLSIRELLIKCNSRNNWTFKFHMAIIEIFQEDVYDLLLKPSVPGCSYSNKIYNGKIILNKDNSIQFQGLSEKCFQTELEAIEIIKLSENNRNLGSKMYHISKSNSNLVIFIKIIGTNKLEELKSYGLLTLCDLASSDIISKTNETNQLNKSLIMLGKSFEALRKNIKLPYRESKLTQFLKPSLGGESKCLLFINVKSDSESIAETLQSLKFGQSALQVTPERI